MQPHNTTKVALTCHFCGKTYYKFPSQNPNGRSKFCSRSCLSKSNARESTKHKKIHLLACAFCGKPFDTKNDRRRKYCSAECYYQARKGVRVKTGSVRLENGYRMVYIPDHPRAKSNGYVREHLLVAEEKLGRPLDTKEIVHHLDGNRSNNHPDNLEILNSQSEHMSLHMIEFHAANPDFRHIPPKERIKWSVR